MLQAFKRTVILPPQPYNGRRHTRFKLEMPCKVERWRRLFHATTRNISDGGVCVDIVGMGSSILETDVMLNFPGFDPIPASVRWSHKRTFGMKFAEPINDHPDLKEFIEELSLLSDD